MPVSLSLIDTLLNSDETFIDPGKLSDAAKNAAGEVIRPIVEAETLNYADALAKKIRDKIEDARLHDADRAENWDSSVRIGSNSLDITNYYAGACDGVLLTLAPAKDAREQLKKACSYLQRTYGITEETGYAVLALMRTKEYCILYGEKKNGFWAGKFAVHRGPCFSFFLKRVKNDLKDLGVVPEARLALADPNTFILHKFVAFNTLTANSSMTGVKNYMLLPLLWYTYQDPDGDETVMKGIKAPKASMQVKE